MAKRGRKNSERNNNENRRRRSSLFNNFPSISSFLPSQPFRKTKSLPTLETFAPDSHSKIRLSDSLGITQFPTTKNEDGTIIATYDTPFAADTGKNQNNNNDNPSDHIYEYGEIPNPHIYEYSDISTNQIQRSQSLPTKPSQDNYYEPINRKAQRSQSLPNIHPLTPDESPYIEIQPDKEPIYEEPVAQAGPIYEEIPATQAKAQADPIYEEIPATQTLADEGFSEPTTNEVIHPTNDAPPELPPRNPGMKALKMVQKELGDLNESSNTGSNDESSENAPTKPDTPSL